MNNPDFTKLASSFGIDSVRIDNLFDLEHFLENELRGPLLIEIIVESEDIPLPGV